MRRPIADFDFGYSTDWGTGFWESSQFNPEEWSSLALAHTLLPVLEGSGGGVSDLNELSERVAEIATAALSARLASARASATFERVYP